MASITSLEYAHSKAPANMRSMVQSVALFMNAVSSAIGFALVSLAEVCLAPLPRVTTIKMPILTARHRTPSWFGTTRLLPSWLLSVAQSSTSSSGSLIRKKMSSTCCPRASSSLMMQATRLLCGQNRQVTRRHLKIL